MIEEHYQIYKEGVLRFSKLTLIKFSETADLINELVRLKYGKLAVSEEEPLTWKYYLNISGEYHPTDELMTIFSLDTAEEIIFNKENLELHVATRESYQQLSVHYYNLVNRYPEQELLIRGILFPCDIQTALEAPEGTILAYPIDLIEEQESTLMDELQQWIYRYIVRWHIRAFIESDSLYAASAQAALYLILPQRLFNLRLKRAKTNEAHSFHVRAYLASHGYLDRFYDYMTKNQRYFLYRNMPYIERHSGLKDEFYWLINRILTHRKIPIGDFTARQYEGFDDQFYPNYRYRKTPINTAFNVPERDHYTLEEMQSKEKDTAPFNEVYWIEHFNEIDKKFKNSGHAVMMTKDLESRMYDYSNAVPFPLPVVLMNEWMMHSFVGNYKVLINFKHPTESTIYTTTSDIAFIYMTYLNLKAHGILLDKLPVLHCESVQRFPKPSREEIEEISGLRYPDRRAMSLWVHNSTVTAPSHFYSKFQFYQYARNLYLARLQHWFKVSNIHEMSERGYVQNMINRLFFDMVLDYEEQFNPDGLTMNEWLELHHLPLGNFTLAQIKELTYQLFTQSTGYMSDKTQILRYIQKAMIEIMKQITSYSTQYLYDINDMDIKPINWPALRPGNLKASINGYQFAKHLIDVIDVGGKITNDFFIEANIQSHDFLKKFVIHDDFSINDKTQIAIDNTITNTYLVPSKTFDIQVSFGNGDIPDDWILQELSTEQISSLMNQ